MTAVFAGNGVAFGAWAGNIPRLREAAGLNDAALGVLLLCVSLGAVAAMLVTGRWADPLGTARGSLLSALLLAVALPLPALAPSYSVLLASGVLLGLGLGLLDVCMNAHGAWLERRWGAAIMSSFHAGWSLGELLGAALAGLLVALRLPWALGLAGLLVAACGLAALLLSEERGRSQQPVAYAWPSRPIVILGSIAALSFAIEGGTADWSGVYLRTVLGVPEALASVALGVFAGAMIVFRLTGDALVRRLGPARVLMGGALLAAVGLVAALTAPGLWLATPGFALVGAGVANIVPIMFSAAGRQGAAGVSMVATAGYGAVMAAPPLIGFVSQAAGLRSALMLLALGAIGMAVLSHRVR
jgi:fucose permease